MKLLSAVVDIAVFGVLAPLALLFGPYIFFPRGQEMAAFPWLMLYLYHFVVLGVIIGLVKYRLWRNRLFWILLAVASFAVFAGSQNDIFVRRGDVRGALIRTLQFAPGLAVPIWQLIMAVSWGTRTLKGERRIPK